MSLSCLSALLVSPTPSSPCALVIPDVLCPMTRIRWQLQAASPPSPCSSLAPKSAKQVSIQFFLKAQSIFGKQPSMHMTNSDRARNDMLYSLYRSITSISTHTSHSHSHTHTHSVHSFARLSALLMICKKCSPCLALLCPTSWYTL